MTFIMRNSGKKHAQNGLTLLEMLVVLLITSLIATILLQAVGFMTGSYQRVSYHQQRFAKETMLFSWYRESVRTLVASLDSEFAFSGDTRRMSGYTLTPVFGKSGVLTRIQWSLEDLGESQVLWYQENNNAPIRVHIWQAAFAEFSYRGLNSQWDEHWPPEQLAPGVLPLRIILKTTREGVERNVLAAINLRRLGRYDYRDFL